MRNIQNIWYWLSNILFAHIYLGDDRVYINFTFILLCPFWLNNIKAADIFLVEVLHSEILALTNNSYRRLVETILCISNKKIQSFMVEFSISCTYLCKFKLFSFTSVGNNIITLTHLTYRLQVYHLTEMMHSNGHSYACSFFF